MNNALSFLLRFNEMNTEKTMSVLRTVLANDTALASPRQERGYRRLHTNMVSQARVVIREFTSRTGLVNFDHLAWQLGVDTTPDEPTISAENHDCAPGDLIYLGHFITPGRGSSHRCETCGKSWSKIGDQYAEDVAVPS